MMATHFKITLNVAFLFVSYQYAVCSQDTIKGFATIKEVQCTGGNFKTNVNYLSLTLFNVSDLQVLVSLDSSDNACYTFSQYSACNVVEGDRRKSVIRTLVARLKPSDSVMVGCNVTSFRRDHQPEVYSWSVVVKMNQTTTTTSTTTTTTTANVAVTKYTGGQGVEKPLAASVHGIVPEYFVPPIVLIIGLCLIVFLAVLSLVLLVLQCRQSRRKRRNRAAKRESLLSTKSDNAGCGSNGKDLDLGVTTYRATRSFPSFPPGPPQVALSQGVLQSVLRYQKGPTDDTGYVSGSSNQYSEPYGCHEETGSTAERTRTAPRSVPMPQIKGTAYNTVLC